MYQLEHERHVVTRVLVLRVAREDAAVRVDRADAIALRVARDAQAVVRLEEVGALLEDLLELDARRRPVLLRHERRGQGQPRRYGVGPPSHGRAELFDRGVEIAHAVECLPEARAGLDQVGLEAERRAQRACGRRHLAPGDEGLRYACARAWGVGVAHAASAIPTRRSKRTTL